MTPEEGRKRDELKRRIEQSMAHMDHPYNEHLAEQVEAYVREHQDHDDHLDSVSWMSAWLFCHRNRRPISAGFRLLYVLAAAAVILGVSALVLWLARR